MSVTFQADIDYSKVEKVKVYLTDKYPNMSEEDFAYDPFVQKDAETGRCFEMEDKIDFNHEIQMSNNNFCLILKLVDSNRAILSEQDGNVGSVAYEDLTDFQHKIMMALNKSDEKMSGYERPDYSSHNFHHFGLSADGIKERLEGMLEVIKNARERHLGVFWA